MLITFYTVPKFNSKWTIFLNIKAKTVKLLEEIKREIFVTLG